MKVKTDVKAGGGLLDLDIDVDVDIEYIRFLHSRGDLVLVVRRDVLDCGRELWVLM